MKTNKNYIILFVSIIVIALVGLSFTYIYENNKKEKMADNDKNLEESYEQEKTVAEKVKGNIEETTQINNIEKLTYDVISEFHYLIDSREFEKAYNMLNKEYIEDFDMTKEKFTSLYSDVDKSTYSITEIIPKDDAIYIKYYNIIEDSKYTSQNSSIILEGNKQTITLNGTYNVEEKDIVLHDNEIDVEILKSMKISEDTAYKIKITNKTEEEIYIDNSPMGISAVSNNDDISEHLLMNYTSPKAKENYRISENSTKDYVVKFNTTDEIKEILIKLANGREIRIQTYSM
jgi:hypothetical protein